MRGGARPNSGPKPKYGDLPVKRLVRLVPVAWVKELDEWLEGRKNLLPPKF